MGLGKLAATATAYKLASAAAAHNSGSGSDSLSSSTASLSRSPDRERLPLLPPSEPFASGSASNYQSGTNRHNHGMTASTGSVGGYGAASAGMGTVRASSPETVKRPSAGIDEIDIEELLEDHGLFVGSYRRLIALYTLVPLSLLALLAILAPLPLILHTPSPPLPSPYSDALIGISLWALARALTPPLTSLIELVPLPPYLTLPLTALSHALLRNTLRILGFAALAIGPSPSFHTNSGATVADPSFARIWAFALGCAAADAVAGSAQGYAQLALYERAMVSPAEARALVGAWLRGRKARAAYHSHSGPGASQSYSHSQSHSMSMSMSMSRAMSPPSSAFPPGPSSPTGPSQQQQQPLKMTRRPSTQPSLDLERDLDTLTTLKARDDLADVLGTHAVRVPVFISCLVRVASCVLLVGFTLVLGGVWVCSPLAPVSIGRVGGMGTETLPSTKFAVPFWTTFGVVNVVHAVLAAAHMPPLLARIGLPVVAYAGLLVGLAAFFAGLAVWGAVA